MTDSRFDAALQVLAELERAGYQAYLVGGCVRDMLLGKRPEDYDVATDALPDEVQNLFPRTVPTGIRHGTVSVLIGGERIEVTTFRTEGAYLDARRPSEVRFVRSLEQDLARRDFTVNAMAMDRRGHLQDPFDGRRDLREKRIRAVGEADERFREDALRMLRAIRFAAALRAQIEERTWQAIRRHAGLMTEIARERIRDEWNKMLRADLSISINYLAASGLLPIVFPDISPRKVKASFAPHQGGEAARSRYVGTQDFVAERWRQAADFANRLPDKSDLRQAALFWQLGVDEATVQASLRRLRQPNSFVRSVAAILRAIPDSDPLTWTAETWRGYLYRHGKQAAIDAMRILGEASEADNGKIGRLLDKAIERQPIWSVRDLAVDGQDLIRELQIPPGPLVGQILTELTEWTLQHPACNNRQHLLAAARVLYQHWKNGSQKV